MQRLIILLILSVQCLALISLAGCVKVVPVIAGQPAPISGFNVGPGMFVVQGQPAILTGAIIGVDGLDPERVTNAIYEAEAMEADQ